MKNRLKMQKHENNITKNNGRHKYQRRGNGLSKVKGWNKISVPNGRSEEKIPVGIDEKCFLNFSLFLSEPDSRNHT